MFIAGVIKIADTFIDTSVTPVESQTAGGPVPCICPVFVIVVVFMLDVWNLILKHTLVV
jgi:hypothetical protein